MDISVEKSASNNTQPKFIPIVKQITHNAAAWLVWFFTMTDEDRHAAGIDVSGEGRDGSGPIL